MQAAPPIYTAENVAETVVGLVDQPRAEVIVGGFGRIAALQERLARTVATWFTGRALHTGFLSPEPSGDSQGALFAPMQDKHAVDGGWRETAGLGGAPLATMTSLAALPLDLMAMPLRMLDIGMATSLRLLEAMVPAAKPGPVSK